MLLNLTAEGSQLVKRVHYVWCRNIVKNTQTMGSWRYVEVNHNLQSALYSWWYTALRRHCDGGCWRVGKLKIRARVAQTYEWKINKKFVTIICNLSKCFRGNLFLRKNYKCSNSLISTHGVWSDRTQKKNCIKFKKLISLSIWNCNAACLFIFIVIFFVHSLLNQWSLVKAVWLYITQTSRRVKTKETVMTREEKHFALWFAYKAARSVTVNVR